MLHRLRTLVLEGLNRQVPATGLGLFRILAGLVIFQEILYLMYFGHLVFDRVPYLEPASPVVDLFLVLWAAIALAVVFGYRTRLATVANYLMWLVFVGFTPMWLDFDGGFDQMMTGVSFVLMLVPCNRALALDPLRDQLRNPLRGPRGDVAAPTVSVLCYSLPVAGILGLLYLDAGIHKLSAEFWRNGMGAWLPPTMPYYMSPIDMSWLLDYKLAEQAIGYTLIGFQFVFLPLLWFKRFRVPLLVIGVAFHTGIILSLNIYQFGFGMLAPYSLLVPFSWWRRIGGWIRCAQPRLTVFYDEQCPLCNRTVIILNHFDVCRAVAFKGLQSHAQDYPQLAQVDEQELLTDLYALQPGGSLHRGLDTYILILEAMHYPAPLGWLLRLPGLYHIAAAVYRRIADNRARVNCDAACLPLANDDGELIAEYFRRKLGTPRRQANRIARFLVLVMVLQLNSTLQFGVFFRLNNGHATSPAGQILEGASNAVLFLSHTLLGITPHALYMHDHFVGYNHLLAVTWRDPSGREQWLPLVNPEGRIVAPSWGRVQCWWANIVVTPHIKRPRLEKGLMQAIAFWGGKLGVDFQHTEFTLKMKEVEVPMDWQPDLRHRNLASPWKDIGSIHWDGGRVRLHTPGLDLERL